MRLTQERLSLQNKVKHNLIESKYAEEPVSYGQALVTYHYLQNEPVHYQEQQNKMAIASQNQAFAAMARAESPTSKVHRQMKEQQARQASDSPGNRAVQFEIAQRKQKDCHTFNKLYGIYPILLTVQSIIQAFMPEKRYKQSSTSTCRTFSHAEPTTRKRMPDQLSTYPQMTMGMNLTQRVLRLLIGNTSKTVTSRSLIDVSCRY